MAPVLVCCDLEGVYIPEIWIAVAEATGLKELRLTTRDVKDYDELMRYRLNILDREKLTLPKIAAVIETMDLLPGAKDFLDRLRAAWPVTILSDTYYGFAGPFMRKLGWPNLLCHTLEVDGSGRITGYALRHKESKRIAVESFRAQGYRVLAFGDSYNDVKMLSSADAGFFFHAPEAIEKEFPAFPAHHDYATLFADVAKAAGAPTYG